MDIKFSNKFDDEIHLIIDKEEFMTLIDVFESAITLSYNQIDMWNELESYLDEIGRED